MLTISNHKKIKAIRGATLIEVGLMCTLLGVITLAIASSFMGYSKNQTLSNDAKLDRQSLQELMRAANNYFVVCPNDSSVSVTYLKDNAFLGNSTSLKKLEWVDSINATLNNNTAVSYTIDAKFTGNAGESRYADLLKADKTEGSIFSWQRSVETYQSYSSFDSNLGSQMGYYIESMDSAAEKSQTTGAKICQQQ